MDHTSNTVFVPFKVKDTKRDFLKEASVVIWTTTPWTIPANKALAFNSSIEYSLLEIDSLDFFLSGQLFLTYLSMTKEFHSNLLCIQKKFYLFCYSY